MGCPGVLYKGLVPVLKDTSYYFVTPSTPYLERSGRLDLQLLPHVNSFARTSVTSKIANGAP